MRSNPKLPPRLNLLLIALPIAPPFITLTLLFVCALISGRCL